MITNTIRTLFSAKLAYLSSSITICYIFYFCIMVKQCESQFQFQMLAAIQENNETYCSYLPLVSGCKYRHVDIIQGQLDITPLDAMYLFTQLAYNYQLSFWTPVTNGLSISIILTEQYKNNKIIQIDGESYNGYVYYNSSVKDFNRQIILYKIQTNSQGTNTITFFYSIVDIAVSTMTITSQTVSQTQIQLSYNAENILNGCQIQDISITFMGNNSFLFVCLDSAQAFIFTNLPVTDSNIIVNFSQTGSFHDIAGVVGNQGNLLPPKQLFSSANSDEQQGFQWNIAIFCIHSSNETYPNSTFLLFINATDGSYQYTSFVEEQSQISLFINRIWGQVQQKQFPKWLDIISNLNSTLSDQLYIPGDIVSVYVTDKGNIYIQSVNQTSQINYLVIYEQDDGELIANVTYEGDIVFYGIGGVFIFNKIQKLYFRIDVVRPIFLISQSDMNATGEQFTKIQLVLECDKTNLTLQYDVLWTSDVYPSGYILPQFPTLNLNANGRKISSESGILYSQTPIFNFQVQKYFSIFGPTFTIKVNSSNNVQPSIIDSSTIVVNSKTVDLIYAEIKDGMFLKLIIALTQGIYNFDTTSGRLNPVVKSPCGFTNIKSAQRINPNQYLISNNDGRKCLCTNQLVNCKLVTEGQIYNKLAQNKLSSNDNAAYNEPMNNYLQSLPTNQQPLMNGVQVKKNLYGLLHKNMLISILVNNSIVITNIKQNNKVISFINNECPEQNQTVGTLYFREFYDPFLLIFCTSSDRIVEYIIRNGRFVYERDIPIYGFKTRYSDTQFFIGFNYAFLAVDPVIETYPARSSCCVLRLDPCQYTVSVIQQIIYANHILGVTNIKTIDIALLNQTEQGNGDTSLLKIYYGNTWVSLNETNVSQDIVTQNIQVIFKSQFYNFAAEFQLTVVFNFTSLNISTQLNLDQISLLLNLEYTQFNNAPVLTRSLEYNLTDFCGPIFQTLFLYMPSNNISQIQIKQQDILTQSKLIGRIGINFIQIINPQVFGVDNLSLNDLMIFVTESEMLIYDKQFENVAMYFIEELKLPEKQCIYQIYEIINETSATFISSCSGVADNFLIPIITLNYDANLGLIKSQFDWAVSSLTLRQIFTIIRANQSSIWIGIQEGPMRSITGKLVICENISCSPLYISNKDQFLMNYAAYSSTGFYIIITIDYYYLTIFINPITMGYNAISPNYSLNYTEFLGEKFCSALKIVTSNQSMGYIVISCQDYYYYVMADYVKNVMQILMKFDRYSQCAYEDVFKVDVVTSDQLLNGVPQIQILYAVCGQNIDTIKLQTYQTISSSLPVIYTGYLQVFTITGPTCSSDVYSPIKIIPLSSSMEYNLFNSYKVGDKRKFIYSSINGFLVDNIVTLQPRIDVVYIPLNKIYTYPDILFTAFNPYNQYIQNVSTVGPQQSSHPPIAIALFSIFCIMTVVSIICLIGAQINAKHRNRVDALRHSNFSVSANNQNEFEDIETSRQIQKKMRADTVDIYEGEKLGSHKKSRVSQIELFFWKQ